MLPFQEMLNIQLSYLAIGLYHLFPNRFSIISKWNFTMILYI